jgi:hypothetical protein
MHSTYGSLKNILTDYRPIVRSKIVEYNDQFHNFDIKEQ